MGRHTPSRIPRSTSLGVSALNFCSTNPTMQCTLFSARLYRKKITSSQCLLESEKTLGTRVGRENGMSLPV